MKPEAKTMKTLKKAFHFYLISLVLIPVVSAAGEIKHTVKPGEDLWDLSQRYYGDPWLWERIYAANHAIIRDPHWIYPGQTLDILSISTAAASPKLPPPPREGLSETAPESQPGYAPSEVRLRVGRSWKPDGRVGSPMTEESPALIETGSDFVAILNRGLKPAAGQRFRLLRMDSIKSGDAPGSRHVMWFATAVVKKKVGPERYEMTLIKAVDAATDGDLLEKAPAQ